MASLVGDNSANPAGQFYVCCQLTQQHKQAKAELPLWSHLPLRILVFLAALVKQMPVYDLL